MASIFFFAFPRDLNDLFKLVKRYAFSKTRATWFPVIFISSAISYLKWPGVECISVRIPSIISPLMIGRARAARTS